MTSFFDAVREIREEREPKLRVAPDPFDVPRSASSGHGGYAQAALAREVESVRTAAEGTRNHTLNTAAFSLFQLVAGGELGENEVIDALTAAARQAGLGEREISATIRSGASKGRLEPRTVPPRESEDTFAGPRRGGTETGDETAGTDETEAEPSLLEKLKLQLVDSAGLDGIPEPEPLIKDTLYKDSTNWLIGAPGNGKSFVALDMSGCVGTGESWQSRPAEQGNVIYLVAEGLSGIRPRVRAWESAMGQAMTGVLFLPVAVQAAAPEAWRAFVELCADLRPTLIVVDTQARVTVGLEENSAKDMGEFVHRVDQLRRASRACVLVVHHQGRSGDHMRGSTAMEGAANTIIKVEKEDDVLQIECTKQKDAPEFEPFKLRLVEYDNSAVLMPADDLRAPANSVTPAMRRMVADWWEVHGDDWVSMSTLADSKTANKATFHRAKRVLEKDGLLAKKGEGATRRYRLTREPGA